MNNPSKAEPESEFSRRVETLRSIRERFPMASLSLRHEQPDLFGERQPALSVASEDGLASVWLVALENALQHPTLSDAGARDYLFYCRVDLNQPQPSLAAFLHAAVPAHAVLLAAPPALLALSSVKHAAGRLAEVTGGRVRLAPFAVGSVEQAGLAAHAWEEGLWALALPRRGLLTAGESEQQALERLEQLEALAEAALQKLGAWNTAPLFEEHLLPDLRAAAELRKRTSTQAGRPVVVRWAGRVRPAGEQRLLVAATSLLSVQPWPRRLQDEQLGSGFAGYDAAEAVRAQAIFELEQKTALRAGRLGEIDWLEAVPDSLPAGLRKPMGGEIALVTGAASGIGKACVQSFLERGAAVAGLDVNPAVEALYDRPDFLGIQCDLTDEDAVRRALRKVVQAFGGLDMLVLNAGVFPPGRRIEALSLAEWDRVLHINLDANLTLLREAHPLLQHAPCGGRVVVNASRNALAPGPGAAAYSVSKMALTQLARVAALEWGDDGIRVNIVHPDSVFDTGVWSEEVLQARAAHYNLTVEQYKRRNVLKTELTSRDVSEMIAEMCGPLFSKVTGAQLPVDGGSDRVI